MKVCSAPRCARFGNLKISAGSGTPSFEPDAGFGHTEEFACWMLGQHTRDVIINANTLVHFAEPLFGKHPDGGGTAAYAHALFLHVIDDRRLPRLDHHFRTVINVQFHSFTVTQVQQRVAGGGAFLPAASGEMSHAAKRKHLRTILAGGDVPHGFALRTDGAALGAHMPIGVDLHLHAAVTENSFSHHRYHVHALHLRRDDER